MSSFSDSPQLADKISIPTDPIDTRLVRKLADILKNTGLTEIEVEKGDLKIKVKRDVSPVTHTVTLPQHGFGSAILAGAVNQPQASHFSHIPSSAVSQGTVLGTEVAIATAKQEKSEISSGHLVKSPMVGTIYLQPKPGADFFVKSGDIVTEGQTLMIIEAMKTMNPVPAPRAGKVIDILVNDGQPVEFGESLMVLE